MPKIKPSLDVEYQRAKEIAYLRTFFADLCQSVLKIDPPSECFNRFLFEQLSLRSEETEQIDPLIKSLKLGKYNMIDLKKKKRKKKRNRKKNSTHTHSL